MKTSQISLLLILSGATVFCNAGEKASPSPAKAWVAVFDFKTTGKIKTDSQILQGRSYGHQLAEAARQPPNILRKLSNPAW